MPKRYSPEFPRQGPRYGPRRVAQVAADLDISEQTVHLWHRRELIDAGQLPGTTSAEKAELLVEVVTPYAVQIVDEGENGC